MDIDALIDEAMAYEGSWPELRRLRLIQKLTAALRRYYEEECESEYRELEILRLSSSLDAHKTMLANSKSRVLELEQKIANLYIP